MPAVRTHPSQQQVVSKRTRRRGHAIGKLMVSPPPPGIKIYCSSQAKVCRRVMPHRDYDLFTNSNTTVQTSRCCCETSSKSESALELTACVDFWPPAGHHPHDYRSYKNILDRYRPQEQNSKVNVYLCVCRVSYIPRLLTCTLWSKQNP